MEDDTVTKVTNNKDGGNKPKTIIIASLIVLLIIIIAIWIYFFLIRKSDNEENNNNNEVNNETEVINTNSPYKLTSNGLEPFDLYQLNLPIKTFNGITLSGHLDNFPLLKQSSR